MDERWVGVPLRTREEIAIHLLCAALRKEGFHFTATQVNDAFKMADLIIAQRGR